jgi:hypothetical protein
MKRIYSALLVWLLAASQVLAAIAPISGSQWADNRDGEIAATSVDFVLAGTYSAGDLVVCDVQVLADEDSSFTLSGSGNTLTPGPRSYNGAIGASIQFAWGFVVTGGSLTVTNTSASAVNREISCSGYTGADSGTAPDGTATSANNGSGSPSTVAPGSITTSGAGIRIASGLSSVSGDLAAGTGYTAYDLDPLAFTYDVWSVQEKITVAGGAEDSSFSASTQKDYWLAIAITFKASGGGGGGGGLLLRRRR